MNLNEKRILVTGASRGIGLEIAELLAFNGYILSLLVRPSSDCSDIEKRLKQFESSYEIVEVDLSNTENIIEFTDQWNKNLWGLVNNAGVCETCFLSDTVSKDPWENVMQVNLNAPYFLTKGLISKIQKPGRIINISSQLGLEGRRGYSAYCASKFSIIGLTKVWAKELGMFGINVNVICPGWVSTEMSMIDISQMANKLNLAESEILKSITDPLELKRFNTPNEVADLVEYLLSERAVGISGREFLMQTIWNQQ
jgi:NAD(P)-dependent dehydrogenase (short-subunit alcohol dehydrogenase family)